MALWAHGQQAPGARVIALVIAVAGALIPAGWAAKTGTAAALRTE